MQFLPDRVPWYVAGPQIGACIVALYALANERLGAIGTYAHVAALTRGAAADRWRGWFFGGLFGGALLGALLRGGPAITTGYGALGRALPVGPLVVLLLEGGV